MAFTKDPVRDRALLDAVLANKEYDTNELMQLHLNRNEYNVGRIAYLTHQNGDRFVDSAGRMWTELPTYKNWFHMPKTSYFASVLTGGLAKPYSRKFVSPDMSSGLRGEFEMIIRHDGKRIDAITHEGYQETYNFGPTDQFSAHKKLDVDTHNANDHYEFRRDMGSTEIREK